MRTRIGPGVAAALVLAAPALAQQQPDRSVTRLGDLRLTLDQQAKVALGVQTLTIVPDGTASSVEISQGQGSTEKTALGLGQLGAGFTWSEDLPIYLEGFLGYARYDPRFVVTRGEESRRLSVAWNTASVTVGVGWSFAITDRFQIRPILNASLGYVANDLTLGSALLNYLTGVDLQFLRKGQAATGGYGGSLVFAWYDYRESFEFEAELRFTRMQLQTLPVYSNNISVNTDASTASLWLRYREPIPGLEAWGRPVRWVAEMYHSEFLTAAQRYVLGADRLTRVGGGIEFDTGRWELGAFGVNLNRVRLTGNVIFGENVSGWSVGLGMSF
ncbi:hypothetical protein [Falsiroseomonas sp. HW251]|uniref:hypothetical protein n=1 Tax=Falsiroseomonas sp. HW251 TaxID=3390998 RepID=UPI003D320BFD